MIESATGVILRTRPLTETSLIVHWLTHDCGRIATVAKGARRPKSPFLGKLDLFYVANFSFTRSRHSDLHTLREIGLRQTHDALRRDLDYLRQASYCAALVEQATETETPLPNVYELMIGLLGTLPLQAPQPQSVFAFEIKLLADLGLQPDFTGSHLSAGARSILQRLNQDDWESLARLRPTNAQVAELRQFLNGYLVYHLGRVPKHRNAAIPG